MVLAWKLDVLCTFASALMIGLPGCESKPLAVSPGERGTLADPRDVAPSVYEVTTTAPDFAVFARDTTVSVTETAPQISALSGTASAAPPPAVLTGTDSDPSATSLILANVVPGATVDSTILILVREGDATYSVTSGLDAYGIPYDLVFVPKTGFSLPVLNTSSTQGSYGGIISLSELAFEYDTGFGSGISLDQYNSIYAYQLAFGVRFVRIDAFPQAAFGTTTAPEGSGCCSLDDEQMISLTNSSGFRKVRPWWRFLRGYYRCRYQRLRRPSADGVVYWLGYGVVAFLELFTARVHSLDDARPVFGCPQNIPEYSD
jgi:hypothetical protein